MELDFPFPIYHNYLLYRVGRGYLWLAYPNNIDFNNRVNHFFIKIYFRFKL
jgi:hypothetical protein